INKLLLSNQFRQSEQAFVLEGVRLVEEAAKSEWTITEVFYSEKLNDRGKQLIASLSQREVAIFQVSDQVMDDITETETPQGVVAVLGTRQLLPPKQPSLILILDAIRDPGNVGTILRTASAAGVDAVIIAPETADPFSPKVLRAGMGAQLNLPLYTLDWPGIRASIKNHPNMKVLLADTRGGSAFWNTDMRLPVALIISNEAAGPCQAARELSDGILTIPMPGRSESLNAAIAASLLIYEVLRQRQH
ncbi:MAG: RNA methyltransferase, partial [Anaerolineaceae bacterium]